MDDKLKNHLIFRLCRLTKESLEKKGVSTIWFNAWKYNKEDALWRALILTVLTGIEKDICKSEEDKDNKELEQIRERLYRAIETEEKGGIELDFGGILRGGFKIVLPQVPVISQLKEFYDIIKTGKPAKSGIEELVNSIQRETKKVYREKIQFMEQFEAEFQKLVNNCVDEDGRLVVFIDDLDRCLPEQSIDILEAIKLFLNAKRCAFVIGVDKKVVQDGIKLRYKGVDVGGVDYIEKIIQVPFTVPELRDEDIQEFVRKIAPKEIGKHAEIMAKVDGNPRRIKRLINKFVLQTSLADEKPVLKDMIDTDILAKLLVLELRWDVFYGDLTSSKFLTDEEYLFNGDNVPGNDSERLLRFLRDDLDIGWAENAEIHKSEDGKTIRIFKDENSAEIEIDEKKEKATLKIGDGRTHDLKVKKVNGRLNIYHEGKQLKSLLLKELKEMIDLDDHKKVEERIEHPNIYIKPETLREYYKDRVLIEFLDEEPTLWDINLEQYVYLAGTVSEATTPSRIITQMHQVEIKESIKKLSQLVQTGDVKRIRNFMDSAEGIYIPARLKKEIKENLNGDLDNAKINLISDLINKYISP